MLLGLGVEGGLAGVALVVGWLAGQSPLERFCWDARAVAVGSVASVPLLLLFLIAMRWPIGPLARIERFLREVVQPLFAQSGVVDLALISLAAAIGEEMLFRGLLQDLLGRCLGVWLALVIASVLFGLAHPITVAYCLWAALIGGYLGWLYLASENLLVVIAVHAVYDFAALCYLTRDGTTVQNQPESPPLL